MYSRALESKHGGGCMTKTVEVWIEGSVYRCYPTQTEDDVEKYIVAGVGSVTLKSANGTIVALAPVFLDGHRVLKALAPLIHAERHLKPSTETLIAKVA